MIMWSLATIFQRIFIRVRIYYSPIYFITGKYRVMKLTRWSEKIIKMCNSINLL